MASIVKKRINGKLYYYAVETKWIEGKSRIVWQKYLGKVEDIVQAVTAAAPPAPQTAKVFEFGAVAALYSIAERLCLADTIDKHVSKRNQGASVGNYMLIAAINRCIAPKSKRQIADWFASTSLRRWLPMRPEQLSSQRFWDHMGYLDEKEIERIEDELAQNLVREFGVDVRALLYDATNFFTYIDSTTESELAQRGHSKAKRNDLRQVGLALLVTTDFHIPLLHQVYPGNRPDAKQFESITGGLSRRYQTLSQHCQDITLIFDKGNNSEKNLSRIEKGPFHFVGSLVPTHHTDLLNVPLDQFTPVPDERCAGVRAYRTTREVLGIERTVIVTYSENLFVGQIQGLTMHLNKAVKALKEIQRRLLAKKPSRGGKPVTRTSVEKQVKVALSAQFLSAVVRYDIQEVDGRPQLTFMIDRSALRQLEDRSFGKTILFTDQHDWSTADIIGAYRGQANIEEAFKRMKDPHFLSWSPMFHWTDQKIRVHAFYCVLALTLTALLRQELHRNGIELSIPALLETLSGIYEVAVIYPHNEGRRYKDHMTLTERSPLQQQLMDLLKLDRYAIT